MIIYYYLVQLPNLSALGFEPETFRVASEYLTTEFFFYFSNNTYTNRALINTYVWVKILNAAVWLVESWCPLYASWHKYLDLAIKFNVRLQCWLLLENQPVKIPSIFYSLFLIFFFLKKVPLELTDVFFFKALTTNTPISLTTTTTKRTTTTTLKFSTFFLSGV